jgi:hypothetical protein
VSNEPEEIKQKENSFVEKNKKIENENENKLYKPTLYLAIATIFLVIVNAVLVGINYFQLNLNNIQFQTIHRPILSVGNIEGFVDNQSKTITFDLFLENSGDMPAKYEINKLSYFDQNGNENFISLEFPSSVVFPKSQNRFVYFPVPFGAITNGYLNLTLKLNYTNLIDSSKTYFYAEKFRFDIFHETFSTLDANAN